MTEPGTMVSILASFLFYMMAIFFPTPPPVPDGYYQSQRNASINLNAQCFHDQYWLNIGRDPNKTIMFMTISDIVTSRDGKNALAIGQFGKIQVFRAHNQPENHYSIVKEINVLMPDGISRRGGIWHAAVDQSSGRLFFTIERKMMTAIYYTDNMAPIISHDSDKTNVTLQMLTSTNKRKYHGTCIDPARKLLFVVEGPKYNENDGNLVLYALSDKSGQLSVRLVTHVTLTRPFRPWDCSVFGDYVAVSDHANRSSIQLFRFMNKDDEKPTFVRTVASYGNEPGQVNNPWGIKFDLNGNLLVADRGNKRIQLFQPINGDLMNLQSNWTSNPVTYHLKVVNTMITSDGESKVNIVAAMFPARIVFYN